MAGLDPSFAAALFVGYHASTTNEGRAGSYHFQPTPRVALNRTAVTEAELNAAYAGAMGVPVVLISGTMPRSARLTGRLGQMQSVITKVAGIIRPKRRRPPLRAIPSIRRTSRPFPPINASLTC